MTRVSSSVGRFGPGVVALRWESLCYYQSNRRAVANGTLSVVNLAEKKEILEASPGVRVFERYFLQFRGSGGRVLHKIYTFHAVGLLFWAARYNGENFE